MTPAFMAHFGLGYNIAKTGEATALAFDEARHVIENAARDGREIREWSRSIQGRIDVFFKSAFQRTDLKSTAATVLLFESEISDAIRTYFADLSANMVKLKALNPPLRSEQLDPFIEKILADRRQTLTELDPLSAFIEKLQTIKSWLVVQRKI